MRLLHALAASCAGDDAARCGASAHERSGLALEAQAAIERMLDEGRAPGLDELASMLFVSRSHLCSAFSRETGPKHRAIRQRHAGSNARKP